MLADHGLDIIDAVVATWGDGAALDSFVVRPCRSCSRPASRAEELRPLAPPDREALARDIVSAFDEPLATLPNPDADVRFDDLVVALVHALRGAQPRPARAAAQPHRGDRERRARTCTRRAS